MGLYRDHGIVLRTFRLGEADRVVTVLTQGHGKVRAVAKGVRKTLSRFGGRLEPTSHVALQFYEGRELDVVTQVDGIEQFRALREDLDRLGKAHVILEVADQVAQERQPDPRLYRMVVGALRALAAHDAALLVPAFLLKVLAAEGASPVLDGCAVCGDEGPLVGFDLAHGGVLCRPCAGMARAPAVSPEALILVRRALTGDLIGVLNEAPGATALEVERLATRSFEGHVERRLRAPTVLDRA